MDQRRCELRNVGDDDETLLRDVTPTLPGSLRRTAQLAPDDLRDRTSMLAGRYRLGQRLGRGGMADVFLAHDHVLGRLVAVKVLHAQLAGDDQIVERLRREAAALAAIDSAHVVAIHDAFLERGGDIFLVLRYVAGRELGTLLDEEAPLAPARAAGILAQVLDGVAALHERLLVHRDLKPSNVVVDDRDRAVLIDLGIALNRRSRRLTPVDAVAGTPAFMAPEQRLGSAVDGRCDLYQVGLMLLHALTGVDPAAHPGDVPALVVRVPRRLRRVVECAVAPDPGDRYTDAVRMRVELATAALGVAASETDLS